MRQAREREEFAYYAGYEDGASDCGQNDIDAAWGRYVRVAHLLTPASGKEQEYGK